jgi:tetratricopeptide (TPR) repeat protein
MGIMMRSILAFGLGILATIATAAYAQPRQPSSDEEILERIPEPMRGLRRLQNLLLTRSHDMELAAQLAQSHLTLAQRTGDPRHLGYAQASLSPWWQEPRPPSRIALLRATLHQRRHDFQAALRDLEYVLAADPANAQAWFSRAMVLQVLGDYAAAAQSCRRLGGLVDKATAAACRDTVRSFSGHAVDSYDRLSDVIQTDVQVTPELRLWILTTLAEITVRINRPDTADRHFRAALTLDKHDLYLLNAYADFLLDQNRPRAVKALLEGVGNSDGTILRLALAERALKGDVNQYTSVLAERFASYRQRDDSMHLREEARFALYVQNDPARALALALENWRRQREPWDARLVLVSALAARDQAAARSTLRWMEESGIEDVRLQTLAAQLAAQR